MFHLSVFSYASGATAPKTLVDMPAVPDPAVTLNQNNHVIFESDVQALLFYAFGQTDITQIQFQTPKLRPVALPSIRPFDAATLPTTRPPVSNYGKMPLQLNAIDENSMQLSASTGTSGNSYYAATWFSDGVRNVSQGQTFSMQFTATITAVPGSWTNGTITLAQTLPAGRYAIRGLDVYGTNLAFARLIFPKQQWRPGILCGQNAGFFNAPCFRSGELGDYGQFQSYAQPQLDIFAVGANAAQTGVIDLVKIG